MRDFDLARHLRSILGDDLFIALAQELGGIRLYIPVTLKDDHKLVRVLGRPAAERLAHEIMAPVQIDVPLAREVRALHYRARGASNGRIARLLGMTEGGVEQLFARQQRLQPRPQKGTNPDQLPLL